MATLEQESGDAGIERLDSERHLRLVGGQALQTEGALEPVAVPLDQLDFESFKATLPPEEQWAAMSAEELKAIWDSIAQYRGAKANLIFEQTQQHDAALRLGIWVNGYIKDRL